MFKTPKVAQEDAYMVCYTVCFQRAVVNSLENTQQGIVLVWQRMYWSTCQNEKKPFKMPCFFFFLPTLFLMQIFPVEAVIKKSAWVFPLQNTNISQETAGRGPKRSIQLVLSADDWLKERRMAGKPSDPQSQLVKSSWNCTLCTPTLGFFKVTQVTLDNWSSFGRDPTCNIWGKTWQ